MADVPWEGERSDGGLGGPAAEFTLLRDMTTDMDIDQEKVFAPITCVIAYDDVEDAI